MASGKFTKEEIKILLENPNVAGVSENRITYSTEFKEKYIKEYYAGKRPCDIFREAGLDPKILGPKRIERASARWRQTFHDGTLYQPQTND